MTDADCLILTTGHHPHDGRLNRHVAVLRKEGLDTVLTAAQTKRSLRLIAAPLTVYRSLRAVHPAVVVFPDPELFVIGPLIAKSMAVRSVIDVHEDYRAVAMSRSWVPAVVRRPVGWIAESMVRWGRRLASATIVAAPHLARQGDLVVPNIPDPRVFPTPDATERRMSVVYVGDVTEPRGIFRMLEIVNLVPGITLELIGSITPGVDGSIRERAGADGTSGRVAIMGRMPYDEAWQRAAGAIAGLSLLNPTPAYREAIPSKLWEYMAAGLPIIASDLPAQRSLIEKSHSGIVVTSAEDAATAIRRWASHPEEAAEMGTAGRTYYRSAVANAQGSRLLVRAVKGPN